MVEQEAARSREIADAVVARAEATTRALRRELATLREAAAQRRRRREQEARSGALGPDARRIQDRVDRGETSWEAVVDGGDTSAAAQRARTHVARCLEELRWRADER